jgi:hypothetical protein
MEKVQDKGVVVDIASFYSSANSSESEVFRQHSPLQSVFESTAASTFSACFLML